MTDAPDITPAEWEAARAAQVSRLSELFAGTRGQQRRERPFRDPAADLLRCNGNPVIGDDRLDLLFCSARQAARMFHRSETAMWMAVRHGWECAGHRWRLATAGEIRQAVAGLRAGTLVRPTLPGGDMGHTWGAPLPAYDAKENA